ncbi:MAG: arginine deiminase-related protein [Steroidobacteraceae bacterium]
MNAIDPTRQCAAALFLVRPAAFGFNAETAASNAMQDAGAAIRDAAERARAEFDGVVRALRGAGVRLSVGVDVAPPMRPDAVFPNNWFSLQRDGTAVLYPMCAPNRRLERRAEYLVQISEELGFVEQRRIDLGSHEQQGQFLEGTGSLVLDHVQRLAYACRSPRTDAALLREWCGLLGYEPVLFDARDPQGVAYYHTNVMLSIGARCAVAALDGVPATQAAPLRERLRSGGRELIEIDAGAVAGFAGNLLEITGHDAHGQAQQYWAMSESARLALGAERCARLTAGGERLLSVAIPTIERLGGGSLRCMLAEVPS